ncbi:probable ATP-dependent RNA helicase DHX58 [Aplysia californica]|uniref:RNA helicase n=1 Tax=Aplysia californica TaxID=6500 RepID=A0ABM1VVV7_APLCA|nr:probable ATP-dependent RNA helicase DHX58 [Aplysia californica]XP_005090199.1 probable ATP-dependent RNA helicase DHX58 [Aplysia californica]XP_035826549.1 probable ATP-dependent RNA helicase DHX58 [Aplysia californica]
MAEASEGMEEFCDNFFKIKLTEKEFQSPAFERLLENGTLHRNEIEKIREEDEFDEREDLSDTKAGFSDDDEAQGGVDGHETDLRLRDYQFELAEEAVKGYNTVVCAPTGSGKTRVATYVIQKHLEKEEATNAVKKVVFLARTVPLVKQQYDNLQRHLGNKYSILKVSGGEEISLKLHMIIDTYDIIVMTPQILLNHLNFDLIPSLEILSLVVFDECHHTNKKETYNILMQAYHKTRMENGGEKMPQILGLTASLGVGNAQTIDGAYENIVKVCGNLDVRKISTVSKHVSELQKHTPVPTEENVNLQRRGLDNFVENMNSYMTKIEKRIKRLAEGLSCGGVHEELNMLPPDKKLQAYRQRIVLVRQAVETCKPQEDRIKDKGLLISLTRRLEVCSEALDLYDLADTQEVQKFLLKKIMDVPDENLRELPEMDPASASPNKNLQNLEKVLQEHLVEKSQSSRCIIFVSTRALAKALTGWMNRLNPSVRHLKAAVFSGTSASKDKDGTSKIEQNLLLKSFREGEVNVLVATTVAEEGLDITECSLVIMYNHVGNEVSRIQRMGRCRQFNGVSVLMAMPEDRPRDYLNREKAVLMNNALKDIGQKRQEFERKVKQFIEMELEPDIKALSSTSDVTQVPERILEFKCKICHRLAVKSCDLRLIHKMHRVVVNGDFLDNIELLYQRPKNVSELRFIAKVFCKEKECDNSIGTLLIYKYTPFVVLCRENLHCPSLKSNWKWKDASEKGCKCADIQPHDFKEYLFGNKDKWYEPPSVGATKQRRPPPAGPSVVPAPEADNRQVEPAIQIGQASNAEDTNCENGGIEGLGDLDEAQRILADAPPLDILSLTRQNVLSDFALHQTSFESDMSTLKISK